MILFISPKQAHFTRRFLDEAAKQGVAVENVDVKGLASVNFNVDVGRYDILYVRFCYPYFAEIISLAKKFAVAGKRVVDAAIADGDLGLGKMPLYDKLRERGIPIPRTERLAAASGWNYPYIVKWQYGFGGKEVFLVRNSAGLEKAAKLFPEDELLIQEFVPADYEYKVITIGYKADPVILRFIVDKKTWRPDFGKTEIFNLAAAGNESLCRVAGLAEDSSRLLGRELAKVDILQRGENFYVLEVNRWPGLKSFEELTGHNIAGKFLKYMVKAGLPKRLI